MQISVYKASAGSGKTFALTVHYLQLLLTAPDGGEYRHILGVTFTKKAVAEMKERILSQLYGIAHGLPSSDGYLRALQAAMATTEGEVPQEQRLREQCARALQLILHDYSHFRIQTIDAFFQTVLRGLAHELGLTANLQVDINDKEVLSQAVDNIIDRLDTEPQTLRWLQSFVRSQIDDSLKWDVRGLLKDFATNIFTEAYMRDGTQMRAFMQDPEAVRAFRKQLISIEREAKAALSHLGTQLSDCLNANGVTLSDFSRGETNYGGFLRKLTESDMEVDINLSVRKAIDDPLTLIRKADLKQRPQLMAAADSVAECFSRIAKALPGIKRDYATAHEVLRHLYPLCLLNVIDQEVTHINNDTARYTLAKTPILLQQMIGTSDSPFVFEKIGALLHHVMIDEFQDTSRLQWENFQTLLLESYSRGGRNLLVGDVKQSIYRWRGGDWRILGMLGDGSDPEVTTVTLDTNYRSERQVVEFNNSFYTRAALLLDQLRAEDEQLLGCEGIIAKAYADVVQAVPQSREDGGYVRLALVRDENEEAKADTLLLEDVKQQVRELMAAGLSPSEMTILVRKHLDAVPLIKAFAEEPDLPVLASNEAFILSASSAVCLMIAAMRLLNDDSDQVSRALLRHHDIDVAQLLANSTELRLMPLTDLIHRLYADLALATYTSQEAFVMAFMDYVNTYANDAGADLHGLLYYWDNHLSAKKVPAARADGIRILTIHKSKGLEFHTVLMPFCDWNVESANGKRENLVWATIDEEPYAQVGLLPSHVGDKMARLSAFGPTVADDNLQLHLDELNALYVGTTRARTNLYIWTQPTKSTKGGTNIGTVVATVAEEMFGESNDTGLTVYEVGHMSALTEVARRTEDNRLMPLFEPKDVRLASYPLSVTFLQSNRSQQFMAALDADEVQTEGRGEGTSGGYLERGRLLHRVFQSIRTEADVDRVLAEFEQEGLISSANVAAGSNVVARSDLERWVRQGLRNPMVAGWFDGTWQLFNECNIISKDADGSVVTHRPDRVMVHPESNHIVIVDFKFGTPKPAYHQQVATYAALLSQMHPQAEVEGYLWYVYSGDVERVESPQP